MSQIQNGQLETMRFSYDQRGNLVQIQQGERKTIFSYDNLNNLKQVQDPLGKLTLFSHDPVGRVKEQIDPNNNKTKLRYDANGNLVGITPAGKSEHQFTLNIFELGESYLPPALGGVNTETTYSYNLDKQLTKINRPDEKSISYNYKQSSGQLSSIETEEGNYNFDYSNTTGLLIQVSSPDQVTLENSYQGPLISTVVTRLSGLQNEVKYDYKPDFSLNSISIKDNSNKSDTVTYDQDKDGLLIKAGSALLTKNSDGLMSRMVLDKIQQDVVYNKFGEMVEDKYLCIDLKSKNKKDCRKDDDVYSVTYKRDLNGRVIEKTENQSHHMKKSWTYSYKASGALEKVYRNQHLVRQYKYDGNNNRMKKIENGKITKAKYDEQDRLIEYGKMEFKYNANGDLIEKIEHEEDCRKISFWNLWKKCKEKTKKTSYSYNSFGNLISVILPSGKKIEYLLDSKNRRVAKKVNGQIVQGFIYESDLQIAAETDGSGNIVSRFVYASKSNVPDYMIKGSDTYRIISDQVGTPQMIVNASTGKVAEEIEMDEFGNLQGHNKRSMIPFGFAGGLYDRDSELVHFGAREYDPETGRWTTKDPIGFDGGDTNLYGYVLTDPINKFDSNGKGPIGALTCEIVLTAIERTLQSSMYLNIQKEINTKKAQLLAAESMCNVDSNRIQNLQNELTILKAKQLGLTSVFATLIQKLSDRACLRVLSIPGL